jgi:hypothetical protein
MNEMRFMCKVCGHRTHDPKDSHDCAQISAIIHKGEFKPRNPVDECIAKCVKDVKNNLLDFVDNHPNHASKIHPKMLIALAISNITMNMFVEGFDQSVPFTELKKELESLLKEISQLANGGVDALYMAMKTDTKTSH